MDDVIMFLMVASMFTGIVLIIVGVIGKFVQPYPTNNEEELRKEIIEAREEAIKKELEALKPNEVKSKFKETFSKGRSVFDRPERTFSDKDKTDAG